MTTSHNSRCFILFASIYLTAVASQVIGADGSILAGIGRALVHLVLAVAASVACLAPAIMSVARIQTLAGVSAKVCHVHA